MTQSGALLTLQLSKGTSSRPRPAQPASLRTCERNPFRRAVLIEDRRHLLSQVFRNIDFAVLLIEFLLHLVEPFPQFLAAMERAVGLREQVIVRGDYLFEPITF